MNLLKFAKYLIGLVLVLFVKLPGLLWVLGSVILFCAMLFLAKRFQKQMALWPVLLWTTVMVGGIFTLAWHLPEIRLIDLLYL